MKLTEEHKTHIVKRFAQFWEAPAIRDDMQQEFGITLHLNQIYPYDPGAAKSKNVGKKWKQLHAEERQKYVSEDAARDIRLYHATERIKELEKIYDKLYSMKIYSQAAAILEQIAKEQGQAYTNRALMEAAGNTGEPTGDSYTQINNYFNMEAPKGPVDSKRVEEGK